MIYLDHNATTPLLPDVLAEMQRVAATADGNPGSRHAAGRRARQVLEGAREEIAAVLGAQPTEVTFTSGGTEATNMALRGFAQGRRGVVVLPQGEHPATSETVANLHNCQPAFLPLDSQGRLIADQFDAAPWSAAVCATLLLAHNETGVIHDVTALRSRCEQHRIPWHLDAVQAVGKIPVNFRELGCTTLALGAHKFGGPRGVGALLIRKDVKLPPLLTGGHQEAGLRPGTEPVMLIAGMARALTIWQQHRAMRHAACSALRDQLQQGLLAAVAGAVVHCLQAPRLPNTLSIAFPGCAAEALLVGLDLAGLCCSLGSACASGSTKPSPVLVAMQLPAAVAASTLRLSVGPQNTAEEMDAAVRIIAEVVTRLRGK